MVLVSQPTHPAFYDRDVRHHKCNVCLSEFTCAPPTRHELMESFTGPELASLIDFGSIIAAEESVSQEMEREMQQMSILARGLRNNNHWIKGVYLITAVTKDDGLISLPIDQNETLDTIRNRLGENLRLTLRGRQLRLTRRGSLEGVSEADLPSAFANLQAPATIYLEAEDQSNCGDDHIAAVNLTRPLREPPNQVEVDRLIGKVCEKYPSARHVEVTHFIGGPCDEDEIVTCVVPGGGGRGWTVMKNLTDAVQLAHSRAVHRSPAQGDIAGGQSVKLVGLQARADLNEEMGLTLRFVESSGRWLVRLRNGEGKQLKPSNLQPFDGCHGRVYAFWGDARWSRTQLLGEIARGHWGLCHASVSDLIVRPQERWRSLEGRLVFAPVTEMTERLLQEGQRQMNAYRAAREAAQGNDGDDSEEEMGL